MAVQWKKMDENYERLMTSEFQSNGEILPLLNLNCDNLATWLLWLLYVCILYAMMMPQHKRYVNMTARIYEVSNWSVEWCVDCKLSSSCLGVLGVFPLYPCLVFPYIGSNLPEEYCHMGPFCRRYWMTWKNWWKVYVNVCSPKILTTVLRKIIFMIW